jgi:hypothetical protein
MNSTYSIYHSCLSGYFITKPIYPDQTKLKKPNTRKLVEQPWQQTIGEFWNEVSGINVLLHHFEIDIIQKLKFVFIQR